MRQRERSSLLITLMVLTGKELCKERSSFSFRLKHSKIMNVTLIGCDYRGWTHLEEITWWMKEGLVT